MFWISLAPCICRNFWSPASFSCAPISIVYTHTTLVKRVILFLRASASPDPSLTMNILIVWLMRNGQLTRLFWCEIVTLTLSLTNLTWLFDIFDIQRAFWRWCIPFNLTCVVLVRNIICTCVPFFACRRILVQINLASRFSSYDLASMTFEFLGNFWNLIWLRLLNLDNLRD